METSVTHADPLDELLARHESQTVDEEVAALPDSLRTPFVLRYLAEKSNAEVAEELGISVAAVEGRLKRAKDRLRMRLIRRGVTLAAAVAMLKASRIAAAEVAPELVASTVDVCCAASAGAAAGAAPSSAIQLANQEVIAMKAMLVSKSMVSAFAAACVASLTIGVAIAAMGFQGVGEGAAVALNPDEARVADAGAELSAVVIDPRVVQAAAMEPNTFVAAPRTFFDIKSQTSEAERRIQSRLRAPLQVRGMQYLDTPLEEVINDLQAQYGIPIQLDEAALDRAVIPTDEPISINVQGVSLRSALRLMLRKNDLAYVIQNEVLLITTQDAAANMFDTRVYAVDSRWGFEPEGVEKLLKSVVAPTAWDGGASAEWYPGSLVVRQTFAVHEEITELLLQLDRRAADMQQELNSSDAVLRKQLERRAANE
jgi:hypothetical protein